MLTLKFFFLKLGFAFWLSLPLSCLIASILGILVAIPCLKMKGLYLAIATLAFATICEEIFMNWDFLGGGFRGASVPTPILFGYKINNAINFYYLCLVIFIFVFICLKNLIKSPTGRSLIAIRDSEISAKSMGINVEKTKLISFGLSSGITGLGGALFAHFSGFVSPDSFNILLSIQLLIIVFVGGLGSINGAIYGSIFINLIPLLLSFIKDLMPNQIMNTPGLEPAFFGLFLALFVLFEPKGISGIFSKIKIHNRNFSSIKKQGYKKHKSFIKTDRLK